MITKEYLEEIVNQIREYGTGVQVDWNLSLEQCTDLLIEVVQEAGETQVSRTEYAKLFKALKLSAVDDETFTSPDLKDKNE